MIFLLFPLWLLLAYRQLQAAQTSDPLHSIQHTPQGWRLVMSNGDVHFAELAGPVRISRCLIVLCWRESTDLAESDRPGRRQTPQRWQVVIWADQINADDWRRFSVALRWRRRDESSGSRMLSDNVLLNSG